MEKDQTEVSDQLIEAVDSLTGEVNSIAEAIMFGVSASDHLVGTDASGGHVGSLGEAVMGITAGLFEITKAVGDLAEAVRESGRAHPAE